MAREFAKGFYKSPAWIRCRGSFIKHRMTIDGGMCQECHDRPGEIVHHRIWLTPDNINDPDFSLNFSNLEFVCHLCHDIIHGNTNRVSDKLVRYEFTPDGNLIVKRTDAVRGKGSPPV